VYSKRAKAGISRVYVSLNEQPANAKTQSGTAHYQKMPGVSAAGRLQTLFFTRLKLQAQYGP
jgi:hypothetical protein